MSDTPYSPDADFDALTPAREERAILRAVAEHTDKLGVVISGSLSEGLAVSWLVGRSA
jgi:hypothetical protein